MIRPSTFSIAAHDPADQAWGIAVASKFPAVGAVVPWAAAGAGAVATQSFANTSYGPRGLELMARGVSANEALAALLADDPQREQRQVGLVDALGNPATFTGKECNAWAGGVIGTNFAAQGNILLNDQVVPAMAHAFLTTAGNLANRLYAALLAGDRAGGDRRGRQSAAIMVVKPSGGYAGFNDRWLDYRVDDDQDPVARLGGLLELHGLYFDKSPESDRVQIDGQLSAKIQQMLTRLGYYQGHATGEYDPATQKAFTTFIGNENFEERCDPQAGWIDRPVLDWIFKRFGDQP